MSSERTAPIQSGPIAGLVIVALTSLATSTVVGVQQDPPPPAQAFEATAEGTTSTRSVWSGVFTKAQARRGEELYFTHCEACHGELLEGHEAAPPLTGPGFSANWNGQSMGDMLDRTRLTMPIGKPGSLSRQQVADVLAFVLEANKFPPGDVDLPRQAEMLSRIRFLSRPPGSRQSRGPSGLLLTDPSAIHSSRSASIGSMRAARRAGRKQATPAVTSIRTATAPNVGPSRGAV